MEDAAQEQSSGGKSCEEYKNKNKKKLGACGDGAGMSDDSHLFTEAQAEWSTRVWVPPSGYWKNTSLVSTVDMKSIRLSKHVRKANARGKVSGLASSKHSTDQGKRSGRKPVPETQANGVAHVLE